MTGGPSIRLQTLSVLIHSRVVTAEYADFGLWFVPGSVVPPLTLERGGTIGIDSYCPLLSEVSGLRTRDL